MTSRITEEATVEHTELTVNNVVRTLTKYHNKCIGSIAKNLMNGRRNRYAVRHETTTRQDRKDFLLQNKLSKHATPSFADIKLSHRKQNLEQRYLTSH